MAKTEAPPSQSDVRKALEVAHKDPDLGRRFLDLLIPAKKGKSQAEKAPLANGKNGAEAGDYYTPAQVANMTGLSLISIYRYCRSKHNRLPHIQFSSREFGIPKGELVKVGTTWKLKSRIDVAPKQRKEQKTKKPKAEKSEKSNGVTPSVPLSGETKIKELAQMNLEYSGRLIPYKFLRKNGIKTVEDLAAHCWVMTINDQYGERKVLMMNRNGKEIRIRGIGAQGINGLNILLSSVGKTLSEKSFTTAPE